MWCINNEPILYKRPNDTKILTAIGHRTAINIVWYSQSFYHKKMFNHLDILSFQIYQVQYL